MGEEDELARKNEIAEHFWKHKYGPLKEGVEHLQEQKQQLEDFRINLEQEIEEKKVVLEEMQALQVEMKRKSEEATENLDLSSAQTNMAKSWRKQLFKKVKKIRKVAKAMNIEEEEVIPDELPLTKMSSSEC